MSDAFEQAKRASLAQVLFKTARLVNEEGISRLRQVSGHDNLRVAHTALFPHIDLEGTRLTELARRVGITKQAVGQLVDELEQMGALERVKDPSDGRAKLIRFSTEGRQGLLAGLVVLGSIESELAVALGRERVHRLHEDLLALLDHLESQDVVQG
ncbi:MAG: MarR family transcriptional regulator [Proteobacteria bacterium]|nr:MarR family transcriptional regulator [Pseudomonadota bacterium]MCP4919259.1 MarR family transcriptional regulator [Pseudomonadota bacterium]